MSPAAGATLGAFAGTIQLKKEKKNPNDDGEGDDEPGKLLPQTLPVTVNVWSPVTEAQAGLSFKVTPLSASSQVVVTNEPDGSSAVEFQLRDQVSNEFMSIFKIGIFPNPSRLSLPEWFRENIDISDILTNQGTFGLQQMPNGASALVYVGPIPDAYGQAGGTPINDMYMISPAQDRVVTIVSGQENAIMSTLGYTPDSFRQLLVQIFGTVQFHRRGCALRVPPYISRVA